MRHGGNDQMGADRLGKDAADATHGGGHGAAVVEFRTRIPKRLPVAGDRIFHTTV